MSGKILHVVPGLDPRAGGVVAAVNGLAHAMNQAGLSVEIAAPFRKNEDDSLAKQLKASGIRITQVGPVVSPLGWHAKLKRSIHEAVQRADVVHIHAVWEEVQHQAARACQDTRKPYIISPHGMLDPWSLSQSATRKKLYRKWRLDKNLNKATRIHCCSQIESELIKPLGYSPPHLVEPNGLDLSEFYPLPDVGGFRKRYPQIGNKKIILFLSRLHYKKGIDLLIQAFAKSTTEGCILVLAGPCDDAYREKLQGIINTIGINPDRIIFAGMQHGQERIEAYVDADFFILPSHQENFGIVVAESLAAGTPVVISDKVNIWPQIKEAGVGLICKTEIPSITEAINQMVHQTERPSKERCQSMAQQQYDWREIAKRWIGHLEEIACG